VSDGQDLGLLERKVGDSVPRWMLTVVLWALAGILSFYGSTRYNEGRLLATEERINAIGARQVINERRITDLEHGSITRPEHEDLLRRIENIDTKLDSVLMRIRDGESNGDRGRR
jgi:hypothetical protein